MMITGDAAELWTSEAKMVLSGHCAIRRVRQDPDFQLRLTVHMIPTLKEKDRSPGSPFHVRVADNRFTRRLRSVNRVLAPCVQKRITHKLILTGSNWRALSLISGMTVVIRLDRLARSTQGLHNLFGAVAEGDAGFKSLRDN